jgi:hypothetical protein
MACEEPILEDIRNDILQAQTDIINLPIQNGFSPQRWRTVVNAMLEKITGKPMLHKLRVIHILEADYNLALKLIFGKRLLQNCEKYDTLGNLQDGFRKGRSTMRTLLLNEITNDYNKRLRVNNYVGMTDISGCFDRIVAPVISILNIKNGCPTNAVEMHASTLEQAQYYLKTKSGVSTTFYQHSEETPVHGNGQGAGDSPSQWCQQSAMLFDLYSEDQPGNQMSTRSGKFSITLPMAAFADNTNLLGNDDDRTMSEEQLSEQAQQGFTKWNELLHATGHFMELEKCSCYLSIWSFQEDGYAYTLVPEEISQEIKVNNLQGSPLSIKLLPSDKSQKLLGVMRNPIGNQQDEIERLKQKSNSMATKINLNAITPTQAKMAYESFYLPAMKYSLAITSINQTDFDTIQRKATTSFLASMGFNRHMPREVVYCSPKYQGLGLRHLYDIQGSDSLRLLLQELNHDGTTKYLLQYLLEVIQMESGIGRPILEENRPLVYIEWGWIPAIRDFLLHINAQIINATRTPPTFRTFDSYIMDAPAITTMTRKEQILINRCRLFLQVECVSDISDAEGKKILEEWYYPVTSKSSRSLKKWPLQGDPGQEAWKIWKKFIIGSFTTNDNNLKTNLGRWEQCNRMRSHFAYTHPFDNSLWLFLDHHHWTVHKMLNKNRRNVTFQKKATATYGERPLGIIPIDVKDQTEETYITGRIASFARPTKLQQGDDTIRGKIKQQASDTLLYDINIMATEEEIQDTFAKDTYIDMATDGSYDETSGISSYGWVISLNDFIVAKGKGPAEAHPTMADPLRAEAYGLASGARFLHLLIDHYQIDPKDHSWTTHIDNITLIRHMEALQTEIITPKWNFTAHADILKTAHDLLKQIPMTYSHVKAHQDKNEDSTKLSQPAKLNITADRLAQDQRQEMTRACTTITTKHIHLVVEDITITKDCQKHIMEKSSCVPIQQYFYDKYKWKQAAFHKINWAAQHKVLMRYNSNDQRRILKFCHGWLPTYDRLYREQQAISPRCPLCHYLEETNIHLFQCKNAKQQEIIDTLRKKLDNDNSHYGVDELIAVIQCVLQTHESKRTIPINSDDAELNKCIQDQSEIGWDHILFGRFSQSITNYISSNLQRKGIQKWENSGKKWTHRIIQNIWDTLLQLWTNRNTILYDDQNKDGQKIKTERLWRQVENCYKHEEKLSVTDRQKIFYKDIEELRSEDHRFIKAWLKIARRIIRVSKLENAKQYREKIMMEQYFKWHPPSNKNKKKRPRVRHQKQDLKPD